MPKQILHYPSKPSPDALPRGPLARWNRRGVVLCLGLALWLALVFIYTWPAWAMVLYRLIFDGGVLLLWLAAAVGTGSVLLPLFGAIEPKNEVGLLRFVTAAALGLGVFSLIVLGLGLAGWLNRGTAVGLLVAGVIAGVLRLIASGWRPDPYRRWLAARAGWGWLALLAAPIAAIVTAGGMLPPYLLWSPEEPHGYDVVEYHLQVPREWYEAGRIIPLHHNVFSFFPFNVEMHYLLAMHLRGGPWAGMYLAQFMHGAFILLAVLAACGFARVLSRKTGEAASGRRSSAPILAAIAMATTPWLAQLGAIAYDEGGFLLFGTLAIGWAIRAVRDPDRRIRRFALAGAMAGLACGAKLTAVPEVLLAIAVVSLALLILVPTGPKQSLARRAVGPVVFGLTGLLCFAPWLVRTWAWSGNPVFPELPSLLGRGDFSPVQVERWHRAHSPQPAQQAIPARLHAFGAGIIWNWQFGFLLLPLALAAVAANWRDPDVWFLGAMLFLLAVFWLGFTHLQSRFFILAVPICALLIARLPSLTGAIIAVQALVAIVLLNLHFVPHMVPAALGLEDLSWTTPAAAQKIPDDVPMVLVGDAKAFFYQRPMSRLDYRTVFDADTSNGRGVIEAWAGPSPRTGTQWLLIDPNELERFERTYQPFPKLPSQITAHREPFVLQR